MNTVKKLFSDFSELVMLKHSIFSLPFIFIAMLVASYEKNATCWFGWKLLLLAIVASITARNFAMAVNRYLDRDIDILNLRTKNRPSVDGRVNNIEMLVFISLNGILFIVTSYFINNIAFQLSLPILLILAVYTLFKRFSSLAHLILGVSLGLAPLAGSIAVSAEISLWSVYLAVGVMFWVTGFDLLYSLQDIDFDKKNNLYSIPAKFGVKKTMLFASVLHSLTVISWLYFVIEAHLGIWAMLSVVLSALILIYEHYIVHKDFTKIDKAFFTVNGYLGFMFIALIMIEVC